MSTGYDPILLSLPPPFDRDLHQIRFKEEWTEPMGEAALATVERLTEAYRTGYPVVEATRLRGREELLAMDLEDLEATFREMEAPQGCILPRLNPKRGATLEELEAFLPRYGQACAFVAMVRAGAWLARNAQKRFDWPGTARFLHLAEENWRHLPPKIAGMLVCDAGQANQERAFPLLRTVAEDPDSPLTLRNEARFVGNMIANPIDPKIFDIVPPKK